MTLVRYGFKELNLNRVYCEVYSNNEAYTWYKSIGFVYEGTLRETYWHDGRYYDSYIISILKREFNYEDFLLHRK